MTEKNVFRPRARLLLQLGEQLIRNESIAVLELIKNSYDADSPNATLIFDNIEDPEIGKIIISDEGSGMDLDIIQNVWLEPGSDYKEKIINSKIKTEKFNRSPLGEKGIGRFGVHKLGRKIELITKKAGNKEIYLRVDWDDLEKEKYLDTFFIDIVEREPEIFTEELTGTKIIISKLRTKWTRGMLRGIYRAVNSLCSPFESVDEFKVELRTDRPEWLKDLLEPKEVLDSAFFYFKCTLNEDRIRDFVYEFRPWGNLPKLKRRTITHNDHPIVDVLRMVDSENQPIDLGKHEIGSISFEGYIFDRSPAILGLGISDKAGFKEYLDSNGGVRVYRDKMRVYDYGEPGNDWLSLGIRRVNAPAKKISNNLIIAAVSLDRKSSTGLKEKTNREGFIENSAYETFVAAVLCALEKIEMLRMEDKKYLSQFYGTGSQSKREPIGSELNELKDYVKKNIDDKGIENRIIKYIDNIEKNYENFKNVLIFSANTGLTLTTQIHQVEKIIKELKRVAVVENSSQRILDLVKTLSDLIDRYTILFRRSKVERTSLHDVIENALFSTELRLKLHDVIIEKKYLTRDRDFNIDCAPNMITGAIVNIIDNSIWWLDYYNPEERKIFIDITDNILGFISIIIADNGPGFSLPVDSITEAFVTNKPGGMGLGLFIVAETMKASGGRIYFPEDGEIDLPDSYKGGAIVALCFKKGD